MRISTPALRPVLALVGLVVVAATSGCSLTGSGSGSEPTRDADGAIVETEDAADVFAITVGDCTNDEDLSATEVSTVPAVPCDTEHDNEAYWAFELEGDDFPGATEVENLADEGCYGAFEAFVGAAYEDSRYDYFPMTPTTESWAQGDREVVCFVYDAAGEKLTGSAAGTAV